MVPTLVNGERWSLYVGPTVVNANELRPGDVIHVAAEHSRYREEPVTLRVTRIRDDLLRYYDGEWLWLEGYQVRPDGADGQWLQILARVGALPNTGTDQAGNAGGRGYPSTTGPRMPETVAPNAPRPPSPARNRGHGTVYGPSGGYPTTMPGTLSARATDPRTDPLGSAPLGSGAVPRPAAMPVPQQAATGTTTPAYGGYGSTAPASSGYAGAGYAGSSHAGSGHGGSDHASSGYGTGGTSYGHSSWR